MKSPSPAGIDVPGLYVHIPFCAARCAYCSFLSGIYKQSKADIYLDSLRNELILKKLDTNYIPSTLFIGGGTPSVLTTNQIEKLFSFVPMPDSSHEATVELNPESTTEEKLSLLKGCGINRCSFGVQTFHEKRLRLFDRLHNASEAKHAVSVAKRVGFKSINIDLITAWPGQSIDMLRQDLMTSLDLGVTHISCYTLIHDENPGFLRKLENENLSICDDQTMRVFWDETISFLERHGFGHYEVSNFSLPGYECRHNIDTWKGKEYHGIGLGAHSHIAEERFSNTCDMNEYRAMTEKGIIPTTFSEKLDKEEKARETAVFWLRMREGVDTVEFRKRTGMDFFELYRKEFAGLSSFGALTMVKNQDGRSTVRVGDEYYPVLDSVLEQLL